MTILKIHQLDNVGVALKNLIPGHILTIADKQVVINNAISVGHKVALTDIHKGSQVIKYGAPIGIATEDISLGDWVHSHNVKTALEAKNEYKYRPLVRESFKPNLKTFKGYLRSDGTAGTRNEVWIIPTVGCINKIAAIAADKANRLLKNYPNVEGVYAFSHPYGCSQLGSDHQATQKILANLVNHPNAAGVLVLGLGCENNNIAEFKKVIGEYDEQRVKFIVAQDVNDEFTAALNCLTELMAFANMFTRQECPVDKLVVGLKCGGSDGFSGITANPLVGEFSDKLIFCGGSTVLTEVPEMFGAEQLLMERAENEEVFNKIVKLINDFKEYYISYNQPVYENPSPGNKAGGITTLEEKSLGCVQKGGRSTVVDVIDYGETVRKNGLTLLSGPGNDLVASTALAAAGCQIVLFTTGRGTPLGTVVPTVKISTNTKLYNSKKHWIDYNAGKLIDGYTLQNLSDKFFQYVLSIASGKLTCSERLGFRELAIFKTGVTL